MRRCAMPVARTASAPRARWPAGRGQGQRDVTQPGRPVDQGQGPVGDFGQGVGGAVTGGAVIIGAGLSA